MNLPSQPCTSLPLSRVLAVASADNRWTVRRVDEAAPDDQVRKAGRRLAIPTPWSDVGTTGSLLFGRCRGSGKVPYQVSIDVEGPRYNCTCPSRKFPCKHGVALLYLWAEGRVDETGVAAFAAEWAERHAEQETRPAEPRPAAVRTGEQEQAVGRRAAEREARVDAGLADLSLFLHDLIGRGLAADSHQRARRFQEQAVRMVDAQAPGVANRLRDLAQITDATPDWPSRLTEGLGRLHLLVRAWQNRTSLPDDLVATVRSHVGFTTRAAEVLACPGVTDRWIVVGLRDADEDRVSVRRVWLRGEGGRPALVLFFAVGGAPLTSNLYPGTAVDATLHFYPGRPALRAVVGERADQAAAVGAWSPESLTVAGARRQWRDALAADPWLAQWPVLVRGELQKAPGTGFGLRDQDGDSLAVIGEKAWPAVAVAGGAPCILAGELNADGLMVSAAVVGERLVAL